MPRTEKKCASTVEIPLDPLVPHLAAMLHEAISNQSHNMDARKSILWASWTLPLVCRDAGRLSDELVHTLKWLWLFEVHLHKQHRPYWERTKLYPEGMRACEGLPKWFDVREQAKLSVRPQQNDEYATRDLARQGNYEARCWYARYCAGLEVGPKPIAPSVVKEEHEWRKQRFLCGKSSEIVYTADDLALPLEVEQFVGFLRWFMDSAIPRDQNNVPFELFCGVPGCNRPACIRAPMTLEESDASHKNGSYWSLARCGVMQLRYDAQRPTNMLWCSYSCEKAASIEYDECVRCCTDEELDAPPQRVRSRSTTDPNRVSAARLLTAALERNALMARRLRARSKTPVRLRFYPMTPMNLEWYQESLIDALNLDAGILFAAVHIESWPPNQRPARQLPNSAEWRRCVFAYTNAICNTRRVYVDHADRKRDYAIPRGVDELHVNPNTPPRWMLELKNLLVDIF
jgi:hypothetical protein